MRNDPQVVQSRFTKKSLPLQVVANVETPLTMNVEKPADQRGLADLGLPIAT
jgi:hypothetical protein